MKYYAVFNDKVLIKLTTNAQEAIDLMLTESADGMHRVDSLDDLLRILNGQPTQDKKSQILGEWVGFFNTFAEEICLETSKMPKHLQETAKKMLLKTKEGLNEIRNFLKDVDEETNGE